MRILYELRRAVVNESGGVDTPWQTLSRSRRKQSTTRRPDKCGVKDSLAAAWAVWPVFFHIFPPMMKLSPVKSRSDDSQNGMCFSRQRQAHWILIRLLNQMQQQQQQASTAVDISQHCAEHVDQLQNYFCSVCKMSVCSVCVHDGRHVDHEVQLLSAVCKQQKVGSSMNCSSPHIAPSKRDHLIRSFSE